jgi:hypothetical protein
MRRELDEEGTGDGEEAREGHQQAGRYWARNRQDGDRLGATWGGFDGLMQGLLVDADGRPIALSTTGFHSALGQIRDKLAAPGELRRIAELLLRALADS